MGEFWQNSWNMRGEDQNYRLFTLTNDGANRLCGHSLSDPDQLLASRAGIAMQKMWCDTGSRVQGAKTSREQIPSILLL